MSTPKVLITRGEADGGWADDLAQGLHDANPNVHVDKIATNDFNSTYPNPNVTGSVIQITQEDCPTNQLTREQYRALHGILFDEEYAIPDFFQNVYNYCRNIVASYSHLAIPPTGPKTIPMAMHDYQPKQSKGAQWLLKKSPNTPIDERQLLVDLGANHAASFEEYIKYDVSQYERSLIIEIGLILAARKLKIPIYATCHGAQLVWYLLGGNLKRIPVVKDTGWKSPFTSVSISGSMMRMRTIFKNIRKSQYKNPLSSGCVSMTNGENFEYVEGTFSPPLLNLPQGKVLSNVDMLKLINKINFFDFQHASYMLGPLEGVVHQCHPLKYNTPNPKPREIGTLFDDSSNMVGSFQLDTIYGFQHHPHKVVMQDEGAKNFLFEWLKKRASDNIQWL